MSVHAGAPCSHPNAPLTSPIYQSAVFTFKSLEQVDSVWEGQEPGYIYTRMGNPNIDELEQSIAAWHGADSAVAAASGMAVIFGVLMALSRPRDRILLSRDIYGGTAKLVEKEMTRMDRKVAWLGKPSGDGLQAAWRDDVRVVLVETISNPLVRVADISGLASECRQRGARLVVDNTLASPVLCRPLDLGAAVVVESATKCLGGHSAVIGGIAAGPAEIMDRCREILVSVGTSLDPFAAWLIVSGMKTLSLRVMASCANAMGLARYLSGHPGVSHVHYPGLAADSGHTLAAQMIPAGAGAMLAFELAGGRRAVDDFMAGLSLVAFAPSLGDVRTTIAHPATTSHRDLVAEERRDAGISDGLLRVSAGIEDLDDLIQDFRAGLGRGFIADRSGA